MPRQFPGQKYLVCNSDEGEPGTCKDRDILAYNPHIVIEGMAIAAYAMGMQRRLQLHPRRDLRDLRALRGGAATKRAPPATWATTSSAASFSFQLHAFHGFGAYICGEETALLESLEGKKGQPRFKPPFPASYRPLRQADDDQQHRDLRRGAVDHPQRRRRPTWRSASPTTAAPRSSRWSATSSGPATTRCRWARRSPSCSSWPAACAAAAR